MSCNSARSMPRRLHCGCKGADSRPPCHRHRKTTAWDPSARASGMASCRVARSRAHSAPSAWDPAPRTQVLWDILAQPRGGGGIRGIPVTEPHRKFHQLHSPLESISRYGWPTSQSPGVILCRSAQRHKYLDIATGAKAPHACSGQKKQGLDTHNSYFYKESCPWFPTTRTPALSSQTSIVSGAVPSVNNRILDALRINVNPQNHLLLSS